jgi:hypothetical protein
LGAQQKGKLETWYLVSNPRLPAEPKELMLKSAILNRMTHFGMTESVKVNG